MLSCGKDNRTICWNPQTGEPYGEFPVVTNWTFQTRWNPYNPNLLATASFDGKIAVHTTQNTKSDAQNAGTQAQALDGEDFFNKAQSQPQTASFSLQKAPKWLERPCGASFGFGGKVISFTRLEEGASKRQSVIRISNFAVDREIGNMTEAFETAMSEHDLSKICETRIAQASFEAEKTDWKVIETLTATNPRKELINYLGFLKDEGEAADELSKLSVKDEDEQLSTTQANGTKNNRLSSFFDSNQDGDNFLADLAATKGAKTNNPFHIYSDSESESDKKITRALMLGQFDRAMEVCLREDRLSDAFMIAICGGQQAIDKVQKAYFTKQASGPKYLRLLASVVGKNLWDVVYNADLRNWREVMATLCTYASAEEFPDLCEALGDRLEEELTHNPEHASLRNDASFCYIAGSKLEKVVGVWIAELESNEKEAMQEPSKDSTFSVHARALQSFIEKVTVFRDVTRYQDNDRRSTSDWKLAPLYEKYTEYADIVAAHGHLKVAEKYLDLLPEKYPAAEVARNRVKQATQKAPTQPTTKQPVHTNLTSQRAPTNVPSFEDQRRPMNTTATRPPNQYAPQSLSQPENLYGQQAPGSYSTPNYSSGQQPPSQFRIPPPPAFGAPMQPQGLGPPPRNVNASPAAPPPSKPKDAGNWNDTPESFFKPPTSRRSTPAAQPPVVSAPFPNQQPTMATPPMAGQAFQPRSTPPAPPPPRGAAPPRTMTPHMNGPAASYAQQLERPTSSAASLYAPSQPNNQPGSIVPLPQIPRGVSPYNAPPSGPPAGNRYAPAPQPQQQQQQQQAPPTQRGPPPPNPYASRQSFSHPQDNAVNQYGPQAVSPQRTGPPPQSFPPTGPPQGQGSRPGTAQSHRTQHSKTVTPKYRKFPCLKCTGHMGY